VKPLLSIRNMSKAFDATTVLQDVSLDIRAGEVHALVGQNGSGKSTLIKLLAGYHSPEPGALVEVDGRPVLLGHPAASRAAGFRFVHQDLALVNELSVLENLALGRGFTTGAAYRIRWEVERRNSQEMIRALGFDFDVRRRVGELAQAERTGVAIARALWRWETGAKVLVLDEPTAALPSTEVAVLFAATRRVVERGVAVLYVSHRLDEVFAIADQITVIRDGRKIGTYATGEMTQDRLVSLMVGEAVLRNAPTHAVGDDRESVLQVRSLRGRQLRGIGFDARPGQVLGFAGLTGSGREEVLPLLFGAVPRLGSVIVSGREVPGGDPQVAIRHGLTLVPANRHRQGVVLDMSVRDNSTITDLRRFRSRIGAIRRKRELADVQEWLRRLDVRPPDPGRTVASLSGGNQQKIVLSKWLRLTPRVILLDEPTQGIDVGAKALIHDLIRAAAENGAAVLIATPDDEELCDICDLVYVLRDGEIVAERTRANLTTGELGRLELGGSLTSVGPVSEIPKREGGQVHGSD
jgi:ribose transport system ATP-binding protein